MKSQRMLERIRREIRLLSTMPRLGRVYDAPVEAPKPRSECRVLYVGNYGLYYVVDDESRVVSISAVIDQRTDPRNRVI